MKVKKYIVTSCGTKKDTGEMYCWATAIDGNKHGQWLSQNDRIPLDDPTPVGTVFEVEQNIRISK